MSDAEKIAALEGRVRELESNSHSHGAGCLTWVLLCGILYGWTYLHKQCGAVEPPWITAGRVIQKERENPR